MTLSAALRAQRRDFAVDVALEVGAETLVVVGPSGCGKTTVLRVLAGLVVPDSGRVVLDDRVLFDGERGTDLPPEQRSVGVVFQDYALFPHLSVRENVGYGLRHLPRAQRAARVAAALARVGIAHLAAARPAALSGGERQRVAVARAVVTEPRLLLLDEPLSALDVNTRAHVRRELRALLAGLAIPTIVVTHDLTDAEVLADRIAVMDRGTVLQTGRPHEVVAEPVNAFVAQFTGANVVPAALLGLPGGLVAVDPERLRLGEPPDGGAPAWPATVTSLQVRGQVLRVGLDRPEHAVAHLRRDDPAASALDLGDRVTGWVDPCDARPLQVPELPVAAAAGVAARRRPRPVAGPAAVGSRLHRSVAAAVAAVTALVVAGVVVSAQAPAGASRPAAPSGGPLVALVAANATQPFNAVIADYGRSHPGQTVRASYAGTQILFTQLEQGAPADLFLSADEGHVQQARREGLIDGYAPVSRNDEVIVVPKGNPAGVTGLQDLARRPVKLVIGVPTVPIGLYTRQVLTNAAAQYGAAFPAQVLAHVVSTETDVKQVAHKVALDEADAGIVYRTDVSADLAAQVEVIEIPEAFRVLATNYAAVLTRAPDPDRARQLLGYLLSPAGQAPFRRLGYLPPAPARPAPGAAPAPTPTR